MGVVHCRCAGMDVHKKVVVVCALAERRQRIRSFRTTTGELRELRDWRDGCGAGATGCGGGAPVLGVGDGSGPLSR